MTVLIRASVLICNGIPILIFVTVRLIGIDESVAYLRTSDLFKM